MSTLAADVLLLTATPVESKTTLQAFAAATQHKAEPQSLDGRIYFDLGTVNGARVCLTQSEMGAGGLGATLQTTHKGITALQPAAVIMVGIAFGVNAAKQAIGDILVTEQLRLYDLQRMGTADGQPCIVLRSDKPHSSPWLLNHLKSADLLWDGARVRFGCILSGEKLVDNLDFREQLRGFEPEAIGGEMEGAGLYVACQDQKVDWILVKAICDWADGHKAQDKDARQQTAAANAAAFVLHALQFAPVDWTQKRRDSAALAIQNTGSGSVAMDHSVAAGAGGVSVGRDVHGNIIVTAPAAPSAPLHSSLPPQPFFFGREPELALIADAIAPEARTWGVLIDGPGGIGKTALAVRAGYLAPTAHYPYKIFLSAKVRELTPAGEQPLEDFMLSNYMALLSELARELGEDQVAKIPENERANAVRRLLTTKHALLLIDNLETFPEAERNRLFQFLGRLPPGCKAIVTSRRRADLDARAVRLDRMAQQDALALLAALAKTNRHLAAAGEAGWQTLYEITTGNPLLLRWTVGQLGRRGSQCRTVAEACDYVQHAPPDNDPLEYIFGDLLDTFTPNETSVLAALTHFTQPAQVEWIADVAQLATSQAQTALEDLADRALLVSDPSAQAFTLPPLAVQFLRAKRPEAVAQSGDRLADRAYELALEHGYKKHDHFPTLQAEWPTLAAALPRFVQDENGRLQTLCDALDFFLDFSGRWDDLLWLGQQAEAKALAAHDLDNAGWRAYQAGWMYHLRGQAAETLACADRAEAHWRAAKAGARQQSIAIRLRGIGHKIEKDYAAAIAAFQQALGLRCTLDPESDDVAIVLNDLAETKRLSGDYAAAERDYTEALRIAKQIKGRECVAIFTGNLAALALDREDWPAAARLAREALPLAEALGRLVLDHS